MDGFINFNCDWVVYKDGFGNFFGEFWFGNEYFYFFIKIFLIFYVEMESFLGKKVYVLYNLFQIGLLVEKYWFKVDNYLGIVGDVLQFLNGVVFFIIYIGFDIKLQ